MRPSPAVVSLAFAALTFGLVAGGQGTLSSSVVAYTGQSAPETAGPTFLLLFTPSISRDGDVAFRAQLTGAGVHSGNNAGIWRQSGGPVALLLRTGDPTPIAGSTWSTPLGDPNAQEVSGSARAAFNAFLLGSPSGTSLWSEPPGGLRLVAIQNGVAPGIAGATFSLLPSGKQMFDDSGQVLFAARVTGGGSTAANDSGLWLDNGTTTTLVAREGDAAPGMPGGTLLADEFPAFGAAPLAPGGITAFLQTVLVGGVFKVGLWSTHGGTLGLRAAEDGGAPGLAGNEHLGALSQLRGNRDGRITFVAPIENQFGGVVATGLWGSDPAGNLTLMLRRDEGEPGLHPLAIVAVLADNGLLYLVGSRFDSAIASHAGVFAAGPSGWRELVRQGDRVADLAAGLEYASFDQLVANLNGQIAFRATITGPGVTSANNRVLVATGDDLQLHLVARTGASLTVAPGDVRTISTVSLTQPSGGGDGVLRGFSDVGGLVWLAGTGGSSAAILVTNLGVPPNVQLVGLEAVQVVQDWRGSVPLIAGKTTFVRAHFQSSSLIRIQPLLRARAAGGGAELPLSPLRALDPDGSFAVTDAAASRGQLLDSTEWLLPPEWTQGAVELEVELFDRPLDCVEAAGPAPNDCKVDAVFAAVPHPDLKIVSVNYLSDQGAQRVSAEQRLELAQRLISALPVSGLAWTASGANWPYAAPPVPDSCTIRNWMYLRRYLDGCREWEGCLTIYYGALLGGREDGCAQISGFAAAGYLPPDPFAKGRHNHTHELAHALGRQHTVDPSQPPEPDGDLTGFCSEVAHPGSPPFPHIEVIGGLRRPTLGPLGLGEDDKVFGLDTMQMRVVHPAQVFDLMSYCATAGIDLWPADVTYEFLKTAIETRFASASTLPSAFASSGADLLLVPGEIDPAGPVATFDAFFTAPAGSPGPAPEPGPYTLRIQRSGGGNEEVSFAPDRVDGHGGQPTARPFFLTLSSPATVDSIEVRQGATVLASRTASAHAPTVQVTSPNGGELFDQATVPVTWSADDADLDPLRFVVQFSADGGSTWTTLEANRASTSVDIDRSALTGTGTGRIRVQASDGLRTASDESDGSFTVEDNFPDATIVLPASGALFYPGQVLVLQAMALDPEDGALAGGALQWSSSLSGTLGSGSPLALAVDQLAVGLHAVTLSAQDSAGHLATAQVQIRVDQPALLFEDDFESGGTTLWQ